MVTPHPLSAVVPQCVEAGWVLPWEAAHPPATRAPDGRFFPKLHVEPHPPPPPAQTNTRTTGGESWVSFEVFRRSPKPLKAGIVATAEFRSCMEFSMYNHRCISAGSVAACSACDLFRPAASPYLSPLYPC